MLEYKVVAHRTDAHSSTARCKEAEIVLDTDVQGRPDAFNPAELLLAAVAACMIKGIERVAPTNISRFAASKSDFMVFARTALPSCQQFLMS